jgi:hypothetical protein
MTPAASLIALAIAVAPTLVGTAAYITGGQTLTAAVLCLWAVQAASGGLWIVAGGLVWVSTRIKLDGYLYASTGCVLAAIWLANS